MIFPSSSRAWLRLSGIAQRVETVVRESVRDLGGSPLTSKSTYRRGHCAWPGKEGTAEFKRCDGETTAVEAS